MYIGAASGAVTIGLAVFLILMSQKPDASEAVKNEPVAKPPVVAPEPAPQPPSLAAVTLPPPPAPPKAAPDTAAEPEAAPPQRLPLKPRPGPPASGAADITPLKPRPEPQPIVENPPSPPKPPAPKVEVKKPTISSEPQPPATDAKAASPAPVTVTRATVTEGRALLKMLEIGKGPVIEIAWPQNGDSRSRLYDLLTACHGMQTALLTHRKQLFAAAGTPGQAWNVNRDAMSGFVRKPAGALTGAERGVIQAIARRHGTGAADPVRLFPRSVDAVLLGGLGQIVGQGYLKYRTIRARYRLDGDRVSIVDVRTDGVARPGAVHLPRVRRCTG